MLGWWCSRTWERVDEEEVFRDGHVVPDVEDRVRHPVRQVDGLPRVLYELDGLVPVHLVRWQTE